jgi:hypothetical protein
MPMGDPGRVAALPSNRRRRRGGRLLQAMHTVMDDSAELTETWLKEQVPEIMTQILPEPPGQKRPER